MTASTPPRAPRRPRVQHVLDVVATERLTPHLTRVHLGGEGFAAFLSGIDTDRLAATDKYIKMLFAPAGSDLQPPYDMEKLRETLPPERMPSQRTYTIRSVAPDGASMAVDFVVHGDEGIAGPWAERARPGDRVAFFGPGGQYAPAPGDPERLYLGDDSAIPAIAAAVAALPADARGRVVIEVTDADDEIPLAAPEHIDVRWLHRADSTGALAGYGEPLVAAVAALAAPAGDIDVFAHGEREAMKRLRALLHGQWGVPRTSLSLSAYWAQGRAEDAFQAEKREPVGKIFDA
ncbi:siderophore-interacting protein [Microbacterium sp.]|uniref:siderophore-interacting protein n=1 Tax=Microbacterium sp. TaxID=51671 RepID=UPI003A8380D4